MKFAVPTLALLGRNNNARAVIPLMNCEYRGSDRGVTGLLPPNVQVTDSVHFDPILLCRCRGGGRERFRRRGGFRDRQVHYDHGACAVGADLKRAAELS